MQLFAFVLLALSIATSVSAQNDEGRIFTVYGVDVDISASTASEARRLALAQAQREAYQALMRRLVRAEDHYRIPDLQGTSLDTLVRSIEVQRERRSTTRYLATLSISFDPESIRQFLGNLNVGYTESRSRPHLVLPVFLRGGAWQLWGDHEWAAAWREGGYRNHLVSFRFADGDLRDRAAVNALRVATANSADMDSIADAFDVEAVLIARARIEIDFATGRPAVEWDYQIGPADIRRGQGRTIATEQESRTDLLIRVVQTIMVRLDADWKAQTILADDELRWIEVLAPVRRLDEWASLLERLDQVSLVRDFEITQIGLPMSGLRIQYIGGEDQLALALQQSQLSLIQHRLGQMLVISERADFLRPAPDDANEGEASGEDPARPDAARLSAQPQAETP